MEQLSDQYLVEKVKSGDMTAFEMLVNRHKDFAYLVAIRVVGNAEDAEEIAHDAFIRVIDKIGSFKGDSKFTTWFYRMVVNLALAKTRKKKVVTDDLAKLEFHASGVSDIDSAADLQAEDRKMMLDKALGRLNEEERVLITLYYYDELSMEEMQEITGLDKNLMKVKIFRARKKMAVALGFLLKGEEASIY